MEPPNQRGFLDLANCYEALSQQGDPLEQPAQVIPWEVFRPALAKVLRRSKRKQGGRPPFDAVLMFKILVLQALYNLSNDQTEYQIRARLSFMLFLGLDLAQRIPHAKRIWLFRETLAEAKVVEGLFAQFDTYLADPGFQPRDGQQIDASLVPVPKQRNAHKENTTIKAGEDSAAWERQPAKRRQKDTEVRWTVKHSEKHYGYKNHVNVDKQHKLIPQYMVTDAAVHDSLVLEEMLLPAEASREVWTDSAYRSETIETQLKARHLRSRIHRNGYRHKPLPAQQKDHNRCRSHIRARVEHVFGHQVTAMGGKLIRTVGLLRARLKIGMKNLTYNFHRLLVLSAARKAQEG